MRATRDCGLRFEIWGFGIMVWDEGLHLKYGFDFELGLNYGYDFGLSAFVVWVEDAVLAWGYFMEVTLVRGLLIVDVNV